MSYRIQLTEKAENGLAKLKKSEPGALKKANKLLLELMDHPKTGTGKPEQLTGNLTGYWSRRITDRHRLIYEIEEDNVLVTVVNAYGHYDDK